MSSGSRTPSPLQLGIIIACLGGFVAALWGPVSDGLDRRFPSRDEVARFAQADHTVLIEVLEGSQDSAAARRALTALPVPFVRLIREFGGKVVIVPLAALAHIQADDSPLTHTAGAYVFAERTAYVSHDTSDPGLTALHEIGHLLDHALGNLSQQPSFQRVFQAVRDDPSLGAGWRDQAEEFFADFFARYYFSDRRRLRLVERFPAAHRYFSILEERALRCPRLNCFVAAAKAE